MNVGVVDLLLVEDNPDDVELTLRAMKKNTTSHERIALCRN